MGLWNTLHTLFRVKPAGKKGVRRGRRPRSRLEVEVLDQRLLPSYQWGMHQVIDAPQPAALHAAAPSRGSQIVGPTLVSGYSLGGNRPAPTESISLNFTRVPTAQISLNFSPPVPSFSWGAGASPD
jgi:hypothetical protein